MAVLGLLDLVAEAVELGYPDDGVVVMESDLVPRPDLASVLSPAEAATAGT